jgi:O-antigen/teichoic acid export membrane protein
MEQKESLHPAGRHRLGRLWTSASLVYGGGAALAFLSQVVLTRLLGAEQYGIYYYVLSWLAVLVVIAKFGIDYAVLRFLPAYLASADWRAARGLLRWSVRTVAASALAMVGMSVLAVLALVRAQPELRNTFLIGCAVLPLWALCSLRQAAMRSMHRNALALLPEFVVAPLFVMLCAGAIELASHGMNAVMAMLATVGAFGAALLLGNAWLRSLLPQELRGGAADFRDKAWPGSALALLLSSGMHMIIGNADAVMIGLLSGTEDVGIYGMASRCAALVAFPLTVANAFFAPIIAEMLGTGKKRELQSFLRRGMRMVVLASVSAALALWIGGAEILGLFGAGFESGAGYLSLLVIGQLINALSGPVAYVVAFSGREALVARVMSATTLFSILLSALLIPRLGALGAAIATMTGLATWNICLYVISCRCVGIATSCIGCGGLEQA